VYSYASIVICAFIASVFYFMHPLWIHLMLQRL